MSTPTVFLSAASDDLKDWRDVLHKTFERAGCKVFTQGQSLGASAGDVLQLVRQHLDKSDFVIHLAGLAYGAEPEQPAFPEAPGFHCSYTQFEYYYAHQQGKQVIAFVCAPDFPYLPFTEKGDDDADRERRRLLQEAHRERVTSGYFTNTPLDPHPRRPLSETIADTQTLLMAVGAAVGTIHETKPSLDSAPMLAAVQEELTTLAETTIRVDISRIDRYAPAQLIGREKELALLADAWAKVRRADVPRPHIITLVALGGEGKTSLVAKWAAGLAHQDWPGCEAAFAWSFYSQGTREQMAASSDLFLKEALTFFGDAEMAGSAQGAFDKGRRLAQLVGERRALLILDGLEPLQYAPTSPQPGELKDQGVSALLKGLAAINQGLCVVTTRYSVTDLKNYWQTTAPETKLLRLSREAGVALLKSLGVQHGSRQDFETLVADVKGHALTLSLLGTYLYDAHGGDIRKRDLVKLEEANTEEQGGHAFHVMDAYVKWFADEGEKGQRAIAVLGLLGLFDRPAPADCLTALKQPPVIPDLTEALVGMTEAQWNIAFSRLETAKLLTANRDAAGSLLSLDAHPLLREYFAQRLRMNPDAWCTAHRRLYEHLCETTKDKDEPTLEDLQPLYQAVAHGCQAGMQEEACRKVYYDRIQRGREAYSTNKLGAIGADLGAVACFFEQPWSRLSPSLTEAAQTWLLNEAAFSLRALGRLTEALEPMRVSGEMDVRVDEWTGSAISYSNLSELELTLGEVAEAVGDAEKAATYADRSGDAFWKMAARAKVADALGQAGRRAEAEARYREAEQMQVERQPEFPLLYSLQGFQYCDLLLAVSERAAWAATLEGADLSSLFSHDELSPSEARQVPPRESGDKSPHSKALRVISQRGAHTLKIAENNNLSLLNIALDHLTLGRAALSEAILENSEIPNPKSEIDPAVDGLRRAGAQHHLPRGLLTRAWLRFLEGKHTGSESAQTDLDEAWEIAERGPMRLHMADIHLYRARLFHAVTPYPWATDADGHVRGPQDDLAAARKLIESCGYWRRKEELEDAEAAAVNW
jgi:tetratricopeptide (TPR) repeat protein